jgi:uncharacterized membrane protein
MSKFTIALFAAALACYLAAWTGAATGLGLAGVLLEVVAWISLHKEK